MSPWPAGQGTPPTAPERRAARRALRALVRKELDPLRRAAQRDAPAAAAMPARVYVFWAQGVDRAPPLVRRCVEELLAHHKPAEVVLLDHRAVHDHVELPGDIVDAVGEDCCSRCSRIPTTRCS